MSFYLLRRLMSGPKLAKLGVERLTEPLHLNIASAFVALLGSYRAKVAFDLIVRPQYAWPVLHAADTAREYGVKRITVIEFGVANGAGLMNLCAVARRTTETTGVAIDVVGFDTGAGMPAAIDYRDHPEAFQAGDFPMDAAKLRAALPPNARLILGPIAQTLPAFLAELGPGNPLGFIAIDVDYYSSTVDCLKVLDGRPDAYLPWLPVYLDDITLFTSSIHAGELLAVEEFNAAHALRKVTPLHTLRNRRIFKNAGWIDQIFVAQIHDHPRRTPAARRELPRVLANEYL